LPAGDARAGCHGPRGLFGARRGAHGARPGHMTARIDARRPRATRGHSHRSAAGLAVIGQAGYGRVMEQPQFWFNTRTGQVETDENKGQGKDLMGPYATREEAAGALDSARRRTEAWDEEDRRWREGEDPE
jgi:hypothetical protein